jgi:hypothetical protein
MGRTTSTVLKVASLIAFGVLLLNLVACGSGPLVATSASSFPATMFDSAQGGFSIKYPSNFVKVEPDVAGQPGVVYQLLLADPTGAKSGDSALDVLGVAVREINKAAKPGDLKKHKAEFEAMARQLIGTPDGLKLASPFALTELGGETALRVEYVYKVSGTDVASVAYLVPLGKRVYWITGQASRATWDTTGKAIGGAISTITFTQAGGA